MIRRTLVIPLILGILVGILGKDIDLYLGAFNLNGQLDLSKKMAKEVYFDTSDHASYDFHANEISHTDKINGNSAQKAHQPTWCDSNLLCNHAFFHCAAYIVFESDTSPPVRHC